MNQTKERHVILTAPRHPQHGTSEIVNIATFFAERIANFYEPGRPGCGYLSIFDPADGRLIFTAEIGKNPLEKFAGRLRNSLEKGQRLAGLPTHLSSWQSRDEKKEKWGGAIRCRYIVSFSGLPEHADEALCIAIAKFFGWMNDPSAEAVIFQLSGNTKGEEALRLAA